MHEKWLVITDLVPISSLLIYWLILESNLPKIPSFSKSYCCSYSCSTFPWFSIWFYTTYTVENPLHDFSIWSYTNYAIEKSLRIFYTYTFKIPLRGFSILSYTNYTFEKSLRGFSIWSYTSYTFEKPLRGFSKTVHLRN